MLYLPLQGTNSVGTVHFAIRTAREPTPLLETIRNTAGSVNASVPLTELRTQQELLDRTLRSERLLAFLSAGFSLVATALAAIGLAGLMAYAGCFSRACMNWRRPIPVRWRGRF